MEKSIRRKLSLVAGIIYLLTFVSIPTLSLYGSIHDPNYIVGSGPDTPAIVGCILEIVVALACIGTAVVLYPILREQSEVMALGLIGSRILEAATIFVGVACLLTIVSLRQSAVDTEDAVVGQTLVTLYDRMFLIGQSFMPAVNDILLGLMLFHSRLVPRIVSLIGIAGGVILIGSDLAVLFGILEQRAVVTGLFAIPVALFELILGVSLTITGIKK